MASAGQDLWIKAQFPEGYRGFGIDVGAADGVILSNTLELERAGWSIMCIEAMSAQSYALNHHRSRFMICAVDHHAKEWGTFLINPENPTAYSSIRPRDSQAMPFMRELRVPVLTLNQIFYIAGFPKLDLISIDIEGTELDALKGLDIARWQPRVIVAECWPDTDAAVKMAEYLGPFGYRDMITLEHDHGFLYVGDDWRSDRQVVRDEPQVVACPGGSVPLPEDGPKRVRRGRPRKLKANLGPLGPIEPRQEQANERD